MSVQEDRDAADLRARELFHYFQPDNPALLPAGPHVTSSCEYPIQKTSPNLVLTALAQLAALKLGVQRTVISLIDRETLYVVAEASRSLNLVNNDQHDGDDGLWLGCSRGPLAETLCEKTIMLKPSDEKYAFFVVEDLQQHPTFSTLPCVAGSPHFRFYAGTPLRTGNGINIGSLYVIDPQPNLRLDDSHKQTLGNIADAVMEYLETSRHSLESSRLTRLLAGLNTFVQGAASSDTSRDSRHSGRPDFPTSYSSNSQRSPDTEAEEYMFKARSRSPPLSSTQPNSDDAADSVTSGIIPSRARKRLPRSKTETRPDYKDNRAQRTFQRAANIMRESLDLGSNGGVVIVGTGQDSDQDSPDNDKEKRLAKLWAVSDTDQPHETREESDSYPVSQMESSFVRRMIRHHPRGGLWYLKFHGVASSSDEDGTSSGSMKGARNPSRPPLSLHPESLRSLREKDLQSMKKNFPNATRIIFAPLWDSLNSRWFGGAFCWSQAENRVFSAHVDLGGLFGFGSSLMVEYSRIQSQESAKQKGDFISTMSHELRSPLHGILASNELLFEHVDSEFAKRLLDTIRACGQTLLETFEQILDFTKINSFERELTRSRSPHQRVQRAPLQSRNIVKLVDVLAVVEEAVESVCSGQALSSIMNGGSVSGRLWQLDPMDDTVRESRITGGEKVDMYLDAARQNWLYVLEPGALRRVVMNVFGNALKHTESGSVSLHIEAQTSKNDCPMLMMTVSDTGRGISNDYLRSHVFTPFSQEDPMSPGAGLGLSLVRAILRSLGGSIAIKSQLGVGTVVKIMFPLTYPQQEKPSETESPSPGLSSPVVTSIDRATTKLKGRRVFFYPADNFHPSKPSSSYMIKQYLTKWFRMANGDHAVPTTSDLVVIDERHLDQLPSTYRQSLLLVLSHRGPSLWSKVTSAKEQLLNSIWLTLPCGPHQLARILLGSLENLELKKAHTSHNTAKHDQSQDLDSNSTDPRTKMALLLQHEVQLKSTSPSISVTSSIPSDEVTNPTVIDRELPVRIQKDIQQTHASTPTEAKDGPRVLLVEDNAINLALLKKSISRVRTQVLHCAVNGAKAVELVQKIPQGYDYIFMDMSMPVMDGFEASKEIRLIESKRPTVSPARIIALTGLGSDEHISKAYAAGVNVFLRKPATIKQIMAILEE
ncbi:CheY-like superfamily [Penicillium griseofulvum]|uniref:histidine kinase n=1 Tax=Penicillium patulum TaxID=5078 RepID=A0A135L983_PENPA|nr:CheY-like superfamily [Penicillium griseofulvum]KXG45518.1 CheY-like superfamily [Penicillium griseofulvum]